MDRGYTRSRLNVDRGYTRSTWAGRFMIGQSTVITNQQGGGRVFKHFTSFCSIACFTTAQACRLGCSLAHSLKEELRREIFVYHSQTFSENTKKSLRFCLTLGISSIPASTDNIALHAAFSARSLKPSSVRQYLYVIGLLHKELSLPNPLIDNWFLDSLFKGIKRVKGDMIVQKLSITTEILFAICLTAFLAYFGNHIYLLVI